MSKSAMIRARIEPKVKKEAERIFKEIGLNASEAISLFYHQVKLKAGLPFVVTSSGKPTESKVSDFSQTMLIKRSKQMTPNERLVAFMNHSYLLKQMNRAGRKIRIKTVRSQVSAR